MTNAQAKKRESVEDVMQAMKPEMNSSDMKESLLAAIEKKVEKSKTIKIICYDWCQGLCGSQELMMILR